MAFGIDDAIAAGLQIIDKLIPDTAAKEKAQADFQMAMLTASNKAASDQSDVDKTEAASSSMFVAGWRPFVGWCCGLSLAWQFFLAPILTWSTAAAGLHVPPLPMLGDSTMTDLLYAMLGLGTLRTADKVAGVSTVSVAMGAVKKLVSR